ncbi:ABC-2 type transport system permease protein [Paenibacillus forsythiae]|uniref:ABC-2 type transport system permease protein n=1 Tax=Paenibacillus forsythiae TaxID=365616 RepID=A0ABU3HAB5_9BACL|nr:ABC-2 family transporter protein [Paenibacillus forsythiae]MDT3427767.1 ABC-2 type transport system permease protein [Paenibacillus forsythiae]
MIAKWVKMLLLYVRFMKANLIALLEYRLDMMIMIFSSALIHLLGLVFLWVIYQRVPDINGWGLWEVLVVYAMVYVTEGISSFLFEGSWMMNTLVNKGLLDNFLIRPVSPILQILSSRIGVNGIGNILIGTAILIQAVSHISMHWTIPKIIMAVVLLVSAIIIRSSIKLASNSSVFWTQNPGSSFPFMIHSIGEFAKYPVSIYNTVIQGIVTVVVPFAFVSFYPAAYLFDKEVFRYWGLLTPVVAIYCAIGAVTIFNYGLKRYESAGN